MNPKVWFITGVSSGLGRALALRAASRGDIVFGTLRREEQTAGFEKLVPGRTYALKADVRNHDEIKSAVEIAAAKYGRIDVLANNAGYGFFGAVEEVSVDEAREQMETNFFGALAVTQMVLPFMRRQKGGHIFQISSIAGFRSIPGIGIYNASKFALEGFSEALYHEAKPLNIRVTIVEPGPFRTNFSGSSHAKSKKRIDDYNETAGKRIELILNSYGKQEGDPDKAAAAILKVLNSENPPLRLPLGKGAVEGMKNKIRMITDELAEWETTALETSF